MTCAGSQAGLWVCLSFLPYLRLLLLSTHSLGTLDGLQVSSTCTCSLRARIYFTYLYTVLSHSGPNKIKRKKKNYLLLLVLNERYGNLVLSEKVKLQKVRQ